jgi:hypothetical protein
VGKGSRLGFLYTGRSSDDYYNHVVGTDGFLRLSRTKSIGFQFLHSSTDYPEQIALDNAQPADAFDGNAIFASFRHASRSVGYGLEYEDLSSNFRGDFGFIPRVDVRRFKGFIEPIIWGKKGGYFRRLSFKASFESITDHNGNLTDSVLEFSPTYQGPLQLYIWPELKITKEFYNGITYQLNRMRIYIETKPVGGLELFVYTKFGDSIDYVNSREADLFIFYPGIKLGIGKNFNINIEHQYQRLSLNHEKIYTANQFQSRLVYHFNVRTFMRVIFQYTDISNNIDLYTIAVDPGLKTLFTQFLFAYKINPQTVLFLGYSDNYFGGSGIDLTQTDRTFFLKVGYALGF